MATVLPLYQRQYSPSGTIDVRASGASPVGQALQQLGGTLQQIDSSIQADQERARRAAEVKANEDAMAFTAQAMSAAHVQWAASLQKSMQEAPMGAPDFAKQQLDAFNAFSTEQVKNAPDPAKRFMTARLAELGSHVFDQAIKFEGAQQVAKRNQDLGQTTANLVQMAAFDPAQAKVAVAEALAMLKESAHQEWAQDWGDKIKAATAVSAAQGLVARDPAGALRLFDQRLGVGQEAKPTGDTFIDSLSADTLIQLRHHARVAVDQGQSVAKQELTTRTRDFQAFATAAVASFDGDPAALAPTLKEYVAAFGERGDYLYKTEVATFIEQARASQKMGSAAPAERQALIDGIAPKITVAKGVDGEAARIEAKRNLIQANNYITNALKEDPAGYVSLSSSRVKSALAAYQQNPSAETFDRYATETLAEQNRMGAPHPKLLLAGEVSAITKSFSDNPPEKAADLVAGLEQTYGKRFPQVYSQLAQDGKLPAAALVIPNIRDAGARARLASLAALKPDDLKALIPAGDGKDIGAKLQDLFTDSARTFLAQSPSSLATVNTIMDQAGRLAYFYRSQGKSVNDAARQAFGDVMGQYTVVGDYRVPKEQNPDQVQMGATKLLHDLESAKLFYTPSPMGQGNQAAQTVDAIQANGTWVTNEDETGLVMKVRGKTGGLYTVKDEAGKPVAYSWAQLQQAAKDDADNQSAQAAQARAAAAERLRQGAR